MKTFKVTFFTNNNSYTHIRECDSEFELIASLHDLEWFVVPTKKGTKTMINKDFIKNITISEVKTDE